MVVLFVTTIGNHGQDMTRRDGDRERKEEPFVHNVK